MSHSLCGDTGCTEWTCPGFLMSEIMRLKDRWGRRNPGATMIIDHVPLQVWPVPGMIVRMEASGKHVLWLPGEVSNKFAKFLRWNIELEPGIRVYQDDPPHPLDEGIWIPPRLLDRAVVSDWITIETQTHGFSEIGRHAGETIDWFWELSIHGLNPMTKPWEDKRRTVNRKLDIDMSTIEFTIKGDVTRGNTKGNRRH